MARLRYTLDEARAEAELLAKAHVASLPYGADFYLFNAQPSLRHKSNSSKHPVVWSVTFLPQPEEGTTLDGGELTFDVDLETKTVTHWTY